MNTRLDGWESNLIAWLAETRNLEFQYGVHDCALFAAGAVKAVTGRDLAQELRGEYATLREGLKKLKDEGYKSHVDFVRKKFKKTSRPKPADIAVIKTPDGLALGIVQGAMIYVAAPIGWGVVPREHSTEFFEV